MTPGFRDWLVAQRCGWTKPHGCGGPRHAVAVRPVENLRHADGRGECAPLCQAAAFLLSKIGNLVALNVHEYNHRGEAIRWGRIYGHTIEGPKLRAARA